jgi:predicted  nucleic acid-binding Zn-ribbon protein
VADFKQTLRDAVRQLSFRTSVDNLKKKGVQQVSVLGLDRITSLIEAAVHRSLRSRLVGAEREQIADATKAEFVRLLRSNEDLQRQKTEIEKQRERAEEELDALRRELAQQQKLLQVELERGGLEIANRYGEENAAIARKVADVVRAFAQGGPASTSSLEQRVMELVMLVISGERESADAARRALRDREVDNLQRRIKKLNDSLATTEHRLQQAAALKAVDGGISSVYREVQGIAADDGHAGRKKELMGAIFKANLGLQRKDDTGT